MLICYLQTLESYNICFLCILNNSGTEEILLTKSACPLPTSFAATPPSPLQQCSLILNTQNMKSYFLQGGCDLLIVTSS